MALRIVQPAWDQYRARQGEAILKDIVLTGFALVDRLGPAVSQGGGLAHKTARAALKDTKKRLAAAEDVFVLSRDGRAYVVEATAVAAGSIRNTGRRVVAIADVGGGTSDFGCFMTGVTGCNWLPGSA